MNVLWTLAAVLMYVLGRLGLDGVMTGEVAGSSLLLAMAIYAGLLLVDFLRERRRSQN
jgi:hypothetical protein